MRATSSIFALIIGLTTAGVALAGTPGFVEDFNSGIGGWGGGSEVYELLLGGVEGAGDNYLRVGNDNFAAQLGTRNAGPDYSGDLLLDGVTGFSFYLKDVGADDDLEIHIGIGRSFDNFWISTAGFAPSETEWQEFSVDITDSSGWTQIIGTGTFADALVGVDRLLIRHDDVPLEQFPPTIQADFGVDHITVLPEPMTGLALLVGGAFALRRRR